MDQVGISCWIPLVKQYQGSKWHFNELSIDSFVSEIITTAYLGPNQVIFQQ